MKRSHINEQIRHAIKTFDSIGFKLPPFAFWSPADWKEKGPETDEIVDNQLGWDVTDYGLGEFNKTGLMLFTIRNGNAALKDKYPKPYAEKIMLINEGQTAPMHFHWHKREDIINRGGGDLCLDIFGSNPKEGLSDQPIFISVDGLRKKIMPGDTVRLTPGESICLDPGVYHKFYARKGKGAVVIGEVSQVNDDENDNRFLEPIGRFPEIEEDEVPIHLLCTEYDQWRNR